MCESFGIAILDGVVRKEPVARADTRVQRISFRPLRLPDLGKQNNGVILLENRETSKILAIFCSFERITDKIAKISRYFAQNGEREQFGGCFLLYCQ